jgi:hypothetical protein
MSEFFAFLSLGVIQGMTYGVIALGMVLIYKGTKTLNFGQASLGLLAAYFCWYLTGTPNSAVTGFGQGLETGPAFIKWLEYPLLLFPFDPGTNEGLIDAGLKLRTMRLPDSFQDQENPYKQYDEAGLNAPHIVETVLKALRRNDVGADAGAIA